MQEGMLARFAMALQRGQIQTIGDEGFDGPGGAIVIDDNCLVSDCLMEQGGSRVQRGSLDFVHLTAD